MRCARNTQNGRCSVVYSNLYAFYYYVFRIHSKQGSFFSSFCSTLPGGVAVSLHEKFTQAV